MRRILITTGTRVDADSAPLIIGEAIQNSIVEVYEAFQYLPARVQLERKPAFSEINLDSVRAAIQTPPDVSFSLVY